METKTVCGLVLKKFVSCEDCQTQWVDVCPLCKKRVTERTAFRDENGRSLHKRLKAINHNGKRIFFLKPKGKPLSEKIKKYKNSEQPKPITWENFFISTYGLFKEIDSIPKGFTFIFSSKRSEYFVNKDKSIIIRASDHWGFGIKFCSWHLKNYGRCSCRNWKKYNGDDEKIGMIYIEDFTPNRSMKPKDKSTENV